jgi:hypothetical protein
LVIARFRIISDFGIFVITTHERYISKSLETKPDCVTETFGLDAQTAEVQTAEAHPRECDVEAGHYEEPEGWEFG